MSKKNPLYKPRKRSPVRVIVVGGVPVPEKEQLITASPAAVRTNKKRHEKNISKWLDRRQLSGRLDPEMIPPVFTGKR